MPRGLDLEDDRLAALRLHDDEKNRSEHVMIVDLLRNDLGRICTMGSVQAEDLFTIEKYQTLLQMTSTVSGTLRQGLRYYDIFRSLFPSGSITGAPKVRDHADHSRVGAVTPRRFHGGYRLLRPRRLCCNQCSDPHAGCARWASDDGGRRRHSRRLRASR